MVVKFFLVVSNKLSEINDLPSKAKLHMLEGFCKFSVDAFRGPFTLMLSQELVEDLGGYIHLSNDIQRRLNKIKGIWEKANISYTSLTLVNYFNVPNSGSD